MSDRLTTHQRREILAHHPSETDTDSSFCRDHHISRDSYYRIKNESQPLAPASTAPKNPHTIYPDLTWELVRQYRQELTAAGYDDGPRSIKWTLIRNDHPAHLIPSTSRIADFLRTEQLTRLNPRKRPHSAIKRFQKTSTNELWQLDGFVYQAPTTEVFTILQLIDDCSRKMLALCEAPDGETTDTVLSTLNEAIAENGKPREILCDNSRGFSLQRFGMLGAVDIAMAQQGIIVTPGPFYHPQNQGKIESAHKPVRKRLQAMKPETSQELDTVLSDFWAHYNHHRQHQAFGEGITPAAAWEAAPKIDPPNEPIDPETLVDRYTTTDDRGHLSFEYSTRSLHRGGFIKFRRHEITFGYAWEGHELLIIDKGTHLEFYLVPYGELIATIDLPLPKQRHLNVTKIGRFVNGDRGRLPSGVESLRKTHPVSEK